MCSKPGGFAGKLTGLDAYGVSREQGETPYELQQGAGLS